MSDASSVLDDPEAQRRLDPHDMYRRITEFPMQIEEGWRLARDLAIPADYVSISSVLVAGMGGSAIGGSLLRSYGENHFPVPVEVWRQYGVPGWVNEQTLVVVVSQSGNTEETVSAFEAAHRRDAKLLSVTTGGKLAALSDEWDIPSLRFTYDAQPRAALGYVFTPLLGILSRLELIKTEPPLEEALTAVQKVADQYSRDTPTSHNPAKQLALELQGKVPVVYGAGYLSEVARRWKTQVNENSKNWAFFEEFSELNHNAVVGYREPHSAKDGIFVVLLEGAHLSDRMRLRTRVTKDLLDSFQISHRSVRQPGMDSLAEMFCHITLGDYVSYYLGLLNGVDPTEIEPINVLKEALAKG